MRGQEVVLHADHHLMARFLVVTQTRKMDLRQGLSYELGPIPWSIATVHRTLVKTSKSTLLSLLEKNVPPAEVIPDGAAWMVDAMATLQSLSRVPPTFAGLAATVLNAVTQPFQQGTIQVDFVVDQYPTLSIKCCERNRRATGGTLHVRISNRNQKSPT